MFNKNNSFFGQLFPVFVCIVVVSMGGMAWYEASASRTFYYEHNRNELIARAHLIEEEAGRLLVAGKFHELDLSCKKIGRASGTRLTVILPDGKVVADSEKPPESMESHANRPEIAAALTGAPADSSLRYSSTLGVNLLYVAIPLAPTATGPRGVLRLALPVSSIDQAIKRLEFRMGGGIVLAILAATLATWLLARAISRPLENLREGADHFARGDFSHKLLTDLRSPPTQEVKSLAQAMNSMAAQLDERLGLVLSQRNQLEAVLTSMEEGVVAVDRKERILHLNRAAGRLFNVLPGKSPGRPIQEVIRHIDLLRLIQATLDTDQPIEGEVVLHGPEQATLTVHGVQLQDRDGQRIGALLVMHDISRLRQLESIRKDFVANVSHELKTPITSIKGFVETLQDGAIDNREDARHFLAIISRQTERLNAIVDDLLALSAIEQGIEQEAIPLAMDSLAEILTAAVQLCTGRAEEKGIRIELDCPEELSAMVNNRLLEQAVSNLVMNAIKYSREGSDIQVKATREGEEVVIAVLDHGLGIEAQHLPRLFERFYRSDKARSRKLGGTGLGLAIVKHIIESHHGTVGVRSTPGKGSCFTLTLPAPTSPDSYRG